MSKVCVISQPRYFPGLHYLHRMLVADIFVILDNVQFNRRHEENRAKVKAPGGAQWLTVPTRKISSRQLISETAINNDHPWQEKMIKTIRTLYSGAPHYQAFAPEIEGIIRGDFRLLTDLDTASWQPALRALGGSPQFVRASELPVQGGGPELLLGICKHVQADMYLSGAFGREYLNVARFAAEGVAVRFHEYRYPVYKQRFGGYLPYLSYLDMLFNCDLERDTVLAGGRMAGPDETREETA